MNRLTRRCVSADHRGSATLELTLLVPALVLVLALLVAGGRLWFARATVADAAQAAARAASLARSTSQAAANGRDAGQQALATGGLLCSSNSVAVDVGAFQVAAGTPATVRARVTCVVPFADLGLPGMPGSITLTAAGAAALDTYRERS